MNLGMEAVDAYQVAESIESLREDAGVLADIAIGNCLTPAALLGKKAAAAAGVNLAEE